MARPRTFDEPDVVTRAMELFWTRGYEATSVADLTAALGVHPGSLYRTFGDKHALFLRAIERYKDVYGSQLVPGLLAGGPVLARIRAVLIGYLKLAAEQQCPRGCLVANAAGELLPGDPEVARGVAEVFAMVEDGFLQGLRVAASRGEISADLDLPACAAMITMLIEGLQVIVKVDPDPMRLVRAVDTALLALAPAPG
ncbi:MAG TPA: TetR/AcrR family transcriptional regulator [Pseudonocardia sp.]|nr:TetR/AcrR family transcriptional regulator [Pseudonocardia sp.]